jgi:transcription elongation factor Elf1
MARMIACPGCGAEFDSKEKVIDHVVEAHAANCQICGAKTTTKTELMKHNKEIHGI